MLEVQKTYLGDSVYAYHDGFHLIVFTDNGLGIQNQIYMEKFVFASLIEYAQKIWANKKENLSDE